MKENKRRNEQIKEMSKARIAANLANKHGINYKTGNYLVPKEAKDVVYVEENMRKSHIGYDMIDDDIEELVSVPEISIPKSKKKESKRNIIKRAFFETALAFSMAYTIFSLELKLIHGIERLGDERRLNNLTTTSSSTLKDVVSDATKKFDDEIISVDYEKIAEYINHSDNPDYELFVLYRDYDRKNGNGVKEYKDLAEEVSLKLNFLDDDDNEHTYLSFENYISGSYKGHQSSSELLDRYYEDCKYELLYDDGDLELDQLPYHVKKESKKLSLELK